MISKTMQDAINQQIKDEFASAYLYLSMSAYFTSINMNGFAHWMRLQYTEEVNHAMKFFDYLHDRGGHAVVPGIEKPAAAFKSTFDAFQQYLDHEKKVTQMINGLYEKASKDNDYATEIMLHWFINEQVEEEKVGMEIIEQLKIVGDSKAALLMLDRQLAARSNA